MPQHRLLELAIEISWTTEAGAYYLWACTLYTSVVPDGSPHIDIDLYSGTESVLPKCFSVDFTIILFIVKKGFLSPILRFRLRTHTTRASQRIICKQNILPDFFF